jgi:translation initiation factor RLI1
MPKKAVLVDYTKCKPEKCNEGICVAVPECEHKLLVQERRWEVPEVNPSKWCHGCAKCASICPLKAIQML